MAVTFHRTGRAYLVGLADGHACRDTLPGACIVMRSHDVMVQREESERPPGTWGVLTLT